MGVNGSYVEAVSKGSHIINNNFECKCLKDLQCGTDSHSWIDFAGGWGTASFSLQGLLWRAGRGLCEFSEDVTKYTSIRFCKLVIWGIPEPDLDWVLVGTTHFTHNKAELANFKRYAQPLKMMLKPDRLFVPSLKRSTKKLFYKKKYVAGTQFTNELYDKHFFQDKPFWTYIWSNIDLTLPVGVPKNDNFYSTLLGPGIYKNDWFKMKNENWLDRSEYDKPPTVVDSTLPTTWSAFFDFAVNSVKSLFQTNAVKQAPMVPPVLFAPNLQQAGFFYNVLFQAGGRSVAAVTGGAASEIPRPSCPCAPKSGTQCSACIRDGDLSPGGTISSKAFRRIAEPDHQDELSFTTISEEEDSGEDSSSEESEQDNETEYPTIRRVLELIKKRS